MTHFDLWPLKAGSHDKVAIDFFKALSIVYKMTPSDFELELFSYFFIRGKRFWPLWPQMTPGEFLDP